MTAAWDVFHWAMFSLGCGCVLAVLLTAAWVALDGRSLRQDRPQAPVAQPEPVAQLGDDTIAMLKPRDILAEIDAEIEQWLLEEDGK